MLGYKLWSIFGLTSTMIMVHMVLNGKGLSNWICIFSLLLRMICPRVHLEKGIPCSWKSGQ